MSIVALLFAGIICYGLDRADLSMVVDALWGVSLLIACRVVGIRRTILQFTSLKFVTALFAALLLWVLLSIGPWSPASAPDVWSWVGGRAGTLDRSATAVEFARLLGLAATFTVGLAIGGSDRRTEMLLRSIGHAGAVYAIAALAFYVIDPTLNTRATQAGFENRLTATFFSANVAAGLFGILATITLASISTGDRSRSRLPAQDLAFIVQYGTLVLFLACLVLTASRMGTVAAVTGMALAAFLHFWGVRGHDGRWRYIGPQLIGLGLFATLALVGQLLMVRLTSMGSDWAGRRSLFAEHWHAFLQRPVSGFGLGSFTTLNHMLAQPSEFVDLCCVRAAHNVYLQWLEETGIVGAGLMFAIVALILFEIFRGQRERQSIRWTMRGILGASLALLLHGTADFPLQTPAIATLWALLLGVGYAAATGGQRSEAKVEPKSGPNGTPPMIRWWAPVGLAIVVELVSLILLWGGGRAAARHGFPVTLRTAYLTAAYEILAEPKTPQRDEQVRRLASAALKQAPTDDYAWMLLAHVGGGSPAGLAAFHQSIVAAPLDPAVFKWRTRFAADNWDALSLSDRTSVMQDIERERALYWDLRAWLADLGAAYQGQPFGLALSLVTTAADLKPASDTAPGSPQRVTPGT
jgi:O-antigen ligase